MTVENTSAGPLREFVRRRPLILFFTLAYCISWLGWAPYVLSADGIGLLSFHFPRIMGDSQLAGIAVGAYLGPLTSAFIVTAITEGRAGLRAWRRRLFTWRFGLRWYAFAAVVVPLLALVGMLALPSARQAFVVPPVGVLAMYPLLLVLQILTSGLAEEPGWRDFALVRLQERHGPLVGTLVLSPLWAGWHLPLFWTEWGGQELTPLFLLRFVLVMTALSIVITWVFNRTHQGLFMVLLLHAGYNTASTLVPSIFPGHVRSWGLLVGVGALAVLLVLVTRGRLGYSGTPEPDAARRPGTASVPSC